MMAILIFIFHFCLLFDFEIETNLARSNIRVIKPSLVFDVNKEFNKELVKQIA